MSEEKKPRVLVEEQDAEQKEWPEAVRRRFDYLCEVAHSNDFSVIAAIGLHHEHKRLSVMLSPSSAHNPHLADMCDDIAMTFTLIARRFRQ